MALLIQKYLDHNSLLILSQVNFIEFIVGPLYLNLVKILPELAGLAVNLLKNRKQWGDNFNKEIETDESKSFQEKEEEKAKVANRFLKFREKFEPTLEKLEEDNYLDNSYKAEIGLVEKEKKFNPRSSIISNLGRRASLSIQRG